MYERIISQCKNFFGVKNEDVSFYFVPDYNNLSLVMGIHRDAEAEFCERYLDNPALSLQARPMSESLRNSNYTSIVFATV